MTQDEKKGVILLVDDEAIVRESLREWLEMEGFLVLTAAGGGEALQILRETSNINVGVFDIRMPGMDGVTLLEETTKAYPDIAVIMITAHATVENAVECMRKGAYDYVIKPFPPEKLTNLLSNAIALQNLRKAHSQLLEQAASADIYLKRAERLMNLGIFAGQEFSEISALLKDFSRELSTFVKEDQKKNLPPEMLSTLQQRAENINEHLQTIDVAGKALAKIESKRENISLDDVVRNSLMLAKRRPEVVNANVIVKLGTNVPPIHGKIWSLVQVCNNLIFNAVTATKKGGEIEITTGVSKGNFAFIQVMDTGCGMSKAELQQLFVPFHCGWKEYDGIGLALVVSKNIVESFGGKMEAESQLGNGTTVRLLFQPSLR